MNLALHRGRWLWHVEKWYIDTLLPTGDVLIVLLAGLRICGYWRGRVTAEFYPASGEPIKGDVAAPQVQGGTDRLHFGPATIAGDLLTFATPTISGSLTLVPRFPPAEPAAPLFTVGDATLGWNVEIPDADVTGTLYWRGNRLDLAGGRGYRDRVWTDILPWRLPMRTVRWGRAVAGAHATTWMEADTVDGLVRTGWADGAVTEPAPPPLRDERTLFSTRVIDMPALHLGLLGALLGSMADPHQTRFAARATIGGADGPAVHEVVRWR